METTNISCPRCHSRDKNTNGSCYDCGFSIQDALASLKELYAEREKELAKKDAEIARLKATIAEQKHLFAKGARNIGKFTLAETDEWRARAETAEAKLADANKKLGLLRDGKVRPLASNDFRRPAVYYRPLDLANGTCPTLYDTLDAALDAEMEK